MKSLANMIIPLLEQVRAEELRWLTVGPLWRLRGSDLKRRALFRHDPIIDRNRCRRNLTRPSSLSGRSCAKESVSNFPSAENLDNRRRLW